jgi:hypothetical protein
VKFLTSFGVLALCTAITGCSGAKTRPGTDAQAPATATGGHSEINITYTLGHTYRKFVATSDGSKIQGETFIDRTLLRESSIDPAKYQPFVQRVSDFIEKTRNPAQADCRSPYSIALTRGNDTKTLKGCRTNDEGTFGKLVRDGEFLLFGRD